MNIEYCLSCEIELSKDDIALSKKMLGRNIEKFFCIDCFAEYHEKTREEMLGMIRDFKRQGCTLFG